tara:strand:+ start:5178 stop:6509 length:1332 start_codon:yes stop_codon:yes gene_type:complete
MLRKSKNVFAALLSDGTLNSANLPADGTVVTNDNLPIGMVCLVDAGGRRENDLDDIATGDQYAIVQSLGPNKPLMRSPMITKGKETITSQKFVPSAQQVTAIGFNGTTGSLPAANSTEYYIRIKRNDNNGRDNSQGTSMFAGPIKSSAAATQVGIADALVINGIKQNDLEADPYVIFEGLSSNAGTAVTSAGGGAFASLKFTKGSKEVSSVSNGVTTSSNLEVGTYVKIAAATTSPIYKITAVSLGTAGTPTKFTLDRPYQGETTALIAKGTLRMITAALAQAGSAGVRITGVENAFDVSKWRNYYVNRFTANFFGGTATLTSLTGANTGTGVWQQVAMDEYMNYGFEGQGTIGTPPTIRESVVKIPGVGSETALTSKYSIINIAWTEDIDGLVSTGKGKGNVLLYLNLQDDSGVGKLDTSTANPGETLAVALKLTAATLNEA